MRVAVTGGCGFIGSHVVDQLLRAGHEVRAIDLSDQWRNHAADFRRADLFDAPALDRALAGTEAVFHLAGAANVNDIAAAPAAAVRLNVEGVARVLDAARRPAAAGYCWPARSGSTARPRARASGPRTPWST